MKLVPKHHGPFPIRRVLLPIDCQLTLLEQWNIHDVFHIDLLTPYRETEFHHANYNRLPPDLMGEEEQYEVEQVLDERIYGHWKKKQYLVKWKGYPDSDNQWLDAKDMENAQELIAEFHSSNPKLSSRIRRTFECLSILYSSSTPSSTLTPKPMSDVSHIETIAAEENTTPLPIPPHQAAADVTTGPVLVQILPTWFVQIRDEDFPHPDEPTPSELNNSNQENIAPSVPEVPSPHPTFQAHARAPLMLIPFTDNGAANSAIVQAITRVHNNIDRSDSYVAQIEEVIWITRTL